MEIRLSGKCHVVRAKTYHSLKSPARVLVRVDQVARFIVNPNHGIV
jgi:hypothetical protein